MSSCLLKRLWTGVLLMGLSISSKVGPLRLLNTEIVKYIKRVTQSGKTSSFKKVKEHIKQTTLPKSFGFDILI